jgi:hypothetical protein
MYQSTLFSAFVLSEEEQQAIPGRGTMSFENLAPQ